MKEKLEKVINVLTLVKDFLIFKKLKESVTNATETVNTVSTVGIVSKIKNLFKK